MKPLYSKLEFENTKSRDKLLCLCYYCNNKFLLSKHTIMKIINKTSQRNVGKFCSKTCSYKDKIKIKKLICKNCNKECFKTPSQINKSNNHFCSRACSATYNNKNKNYGIKISSFEQFVQERLNKDFKNLEFHFNRKDTINSELDIYIPSLKLAFEINGIFHYEPIFGEEKLQQIQNNDVIKINECNKRNINLNIIDIQSFKNSTKLNKLFVYNKIKQIIINNL